MKISRRGFLSMSMGLAVGSLLTGCKLASSSPQLSATVAITPEVVEPEFAVLADGLDFPEGPAFAPDGVLWCTELNGGRLVRIVAGKVEHIETNGRPNGMAFDRLGRAWVCDSGQNAIRRFDPRSKQWETILDQIDGQALLAPNDLVFDQGGNLIFTCPNFGDEERKGYVVCLTPQRMAVKIAEGFYRPNGLEFVTGGKTLVVGDTFQKTLFKGGWDGVNLRWLGVTEWAKVGGKDGPDGMAFGGDGLLYQAIYGDGVVRVVASSGSIVREIKTMGLNPTNVAIDPTGKLGVVVTETEKGRLLSFPAIQPGAVIFDGGTAWE